MPAFEYMMMLMPVDVKKVTSEPTPMPGLNDLGAQGWELVMVFPTQQRTTPAVVFKRQVTGPLAEVPEVPGA